MSSGVSGALAYRIWAEQMDTRGMCKKETTTQPKRRQEKEHSTDAVRPEETLIQEDHTLSGGTYTATKNPQGGHREAHYSEPGKDR